MKGKGFLSDWQATDRSCRERSVASTPDERDRVPGGGGTGYQGSCQSSFGFASGGGQLPWAMYAQTSHGLS